MTSLVNTVDVLLAGFGGLADQDHQTTMYAPAFAAHPGFRVVGVAATEGDEQRAQDAARRLDVPCHDLHTALSTVEAPVVAVAAPAAVRAEVLTTVLRAGRHVLADKPLTPTLAQARQVAEEAAKAGTSVVVAHHHRYHPMITAGAGALRSGKVGLPWNVQADFVVAGGTPCPGQELLNFGGYPVDVVAALTGLPVRRVYAAPAGDLTLLAMDHDQGLTSTIVVGRTTGLAGTNPGGVAQHRYRVSGSHGVLVLDATKPAVTVTTATHQDRQWLPIDTVTALLDTLHTAVTTDRPTTAGLDEAVRTAAVLDAAQRSLDEGVAIPVTPNGEHR
jgi:predicted dehydrogenase